MSELTLLGCRTSPLGSYLSALGVFRAVTRTLDPDAKGNWRGQRFVLSSRFADIDEIIESLHERFEPEAIVSPWSEGSGLREKSSNRTAAEGMRWIRDSTDPRLAPLLGAVRASDRVIDKGLELGWGGSGSDLWNKKFKTQLLRLCRNELPDAALAWLDVAAAVGQDTDAAFSRLLGTGGNFGRQDLSATYVGRVRQTFENTRGKEWLAATLTGIETVPYLRDAVGQFDPGRAGGIQSSPLEKGDDNGFVNPWSFLLTVEGALLFASAVVRRHGVGYAAAALPFQVRGTTSGHASAAAGETSLGEFWAPEWHEPIRLAELEQLLGEGRAEWRDHPARSGLDFARAIANLGVDRGIAAFERYVFVDRLGQNPLAIPAGRIEVRERGAVALLAEIDPWLTAVRRDASATVSAATRGLEQALFAHATSGEAADLIEVFGALGRCHEALGRSSAARASAWPLTLRNGSALYDELKPAFDDDPELRVALALATAQDEPARDTPRTPTMHGLRPLASPVVADRGRAVWSARPVPASLVTGLPRALAAAARLRAIPRSSDEHAGDGEARPAVLGARIAHENGACLRPSDVGAFVSGMLDDDRIASLLAGMLTVDWPRMEHIRLPGEGRGDPVLDLLLPFASAQPLHYADADRSKVELLLRPGRSWPALLAAGRGGEVLADAARRLRIGGIRDVVVPHQRLPHGDRLAAALLLRTAETDRLSMLRRIASLPQPRKKMEEITP